MIAHHHIQETCCCNPEPRPDNRVRISPAGGSTATLQSSYGNTVMSWIKLLLFATCAGMVVVPVYGEPTTLNGTEGNNLTLPHKLMGSGTLRWKGITCLMVIKGTITDRSDDRLLWNSSTGEITIKNLQRNDSGELILNIRYSTPIIYNLTVHATPTETPTETPTATPTGNDLLWLVLVPVLILILVLVGLGYRLHKNRRNRRSAADSTPTTNGNVENDPMMPPEDGAAETPV